MVPNLAVLPLASIIGPVIFINDIVFVSKTLLKSPLSPLQQVWKVWRKIAMVLKLINWSTSGNGRPDVLYSVILVLDRLCP